MRLRLVLTLAALVALAACDQAGQKSGAARAPIGAPATKTGPAGTAAVTTPPVNCPTAQPACPPSKAAHAPALRRQATRTETRRHRHAETRPPSHHYARVDDGLPPRPYRYEELPRYSDEPAVRPYADDYAYDEGRSGYHYYRRGDAPVRHHRKQRSFRTDDGHRMEDGYHRYERREAYDDRHHDRRRHHRYGYGEVEAPPPAPVPPAPPAPRYERYGYSSGGYGRQVESGYYRRESRSYSESSGSTHVVHGGGDCCETPQAAGFDGRGYLTWPGKTPR